MASPFPDLPRADCAYCPTVQEYSGPLVPKPKWTGAHSYDDPSYPSGAGPDDVPVAKPPIGQATPATLAPPTQTAMGGGGGGCSQLQFTVRNTQGHQKYDAARMIEIFGFQYGCQDGYQFYPTAYLGRLPTADSLTNVLITTTSIGYGPQGTGLATYDPFTNGIKIEHDGGGGQGYQDVPLFGRRIGSQKNTSLGSVGKTGWVVIGPSVGFQGTQGWQGPQGSQRWIGPQMASTYVRPQWA